VQLCEYGPDGECGRKAVRQLAGLGMCQSHRRRWLAGQPLDTPVRGYQRCEEGPDGKVVTVPPGRTSSAPSSRLRREPPFAKEMALLRSLGLR
jgi:hypothetical protein